MRLIQFVRICSPGYLLSFSPGLTDANANPTARQKLLYLLVEPLNHSTLARRHSFDM